MVFFIRQSFWNALSLQNFRVHADDQHFFVIRAIEDTDAAALRQSLRGAPQKIVIQFLCARMFEAEHLATLRIDARHHMPDGAVFSGGVHGLKNQQHCITVRCVLKLLVRTQFLHLLFEQLLIYFFRLINRLYLRGPLIEPDLFSRRNTEILDIYFHLEPFVFLMVNASG